MHVRELVPRVKGLAVKAGGFLRRRKRLTTAVVVAALLLGPLVTTDGELVFLNAVGLGFGALLIMRFVRPNGRQRTGWAQQARRQQAARAHQARQTARATQLEGGHDDDASNDDWWDWDKATAQSGRAGRPADCGDVQG